MNWAANVTKSHDRMKSSLVADFQADYVTAARDFLRVADVRIPSSLSDEDISRAYWNTRLRLIDIRPRSVHIASNLLVAPINEPVRLLQLTNKFELGADVNPHQSKAIGDSKHSAFHDLLFNDWGIQHFHLGEVNEGTRFVKRTGQLLFAMVSPDDVYFIAVLPHGSWVELGLLETVHANWPFLLPKAVGVEGTRLTEEQMRTLRKKHCNFLPKLKDGTTYMPLGGGYTISGTSARVQTMSDRCLDGASVYQRSVEEEAASITQQVKDQSGRQVGTPIKMRMELEDGQ